MPVTVQCSQCQTTLSLDEGFRGGVARCSNCGALVPVPRAADEGVARSARPAAPTVDPDAPRPPSRSPTDIGGSSATLISPRPIPTKKHSPTKAPRPPAPPAMPAATTPREATWVPVTGRRVPVAVWVGGALGAIVVLVLVWWMLR